MIGGIGAHTGGDALARHLMNGGDNEFVGGLRMAGLVSETLPDAIEELRLLAIGARTRTPLAHAWASPSLTYSDNHWDAYWEIFELEFDLVGAPYAEVQHQKLGAGGRAAPHRHRVYLRLDQDRRAISLSHSAARQEKISRIAEVQAGERLTSGCYNRSVITHLEREGRHDVATAMRAAGLDSSRADAGPRRDEIAAAKRTSDLAPDEVWRRATEAFTRAHSGPETVAAFEEAGLRIAQGEKVLGVVSPGGTFYPLLRALNKARAAGDKRLRKRDIDARFDGLEVPKAGDLLPLQDFDCEPFNILGLERISTEETSVSSFRFDEMAPSAIYPSNDIWGDRPFEPPIDTPAVEITTQMLTLEQEAAIEAFENQLAFGAAEAARAMRDAAEQLARDEAMREKARHLAEMRGDQATDDAREKVAFRRLKERRADRSASWPTPAENQRIGYQQVAIEQPMICRAGQRATFKADLADLPHHLGRNIKWVEVIDADRRDIHLWNGTIVSTTPHYARALQTSDAADAVMLAHAQKCGWPAVEISGGTPAWREQMVRKAVRAGLNVVTAELQDAVKDELQLLTIETAMRRWLEARTVAKKSRHRGDFETFCEAARALKALDGFEQNMDVRHLDLLRRDLRRIREWEQRVEAKRQTTSARSRPRHAPVSGSPKT